MDVCVCPGFVIHFFVLFHILQSSCRGRNFFNLFFFFSFIHVYSLVCILVLLPHGVMGLSMIVSFPGHTHLLTPLLLINGLYEIDFALLNFVDVS